MTRFNFELFLIAEEDPSAFHADEFLDSVEDALFEAFEGDVTPGMLGGVPVLFCTMEADSPGEALDKVTSKIIEMGLHPGQLTMQLNQGDPTSPLDRLAFA